MTTKDSKKKRPSKGKGKREDDRMADEDSAGLRFEELRARLIAYGADIRVADASVSELRKAVEAAGISPAHAQLNSAWQDSNGLHDAVTLQDEAARRAIEVIRHIDPYVHPYADESGQAQLRIDIPGGPSILGVSPREFRLLHYAVNRNNALIRSNAIRIDPYGNLYGLPGWEQQYVGGEPNLRTPPILAADVSLRWYGVRICLTPAELEMIAMLEALLAIGLGEAALLTFLTSLIPALAVGGIAIVTFLVARLGTAVGLSEFCLCITPLGIISC